MDKIKNLVLSDEQIWISHYVVALFPSALVNEALHEIEQKLIKGSSLTDHMNLSPTDIMELVTHSWNSLRLTP